MRSVSDPARARGRAARGFTLIEAMISMVILAVGVLGIMSMQTASVGATSVSQDFTHAMNLGERMLELLRTDALRWQSPTALTTATKLLAPALPSSQAAGAQGPWSTIPDNVIVATMAGKKVDRNFIPDTPNWAIGFRYCVYYRLAWAVPPTLMRADARVAWAKDTGNQSQLADCAAQVANVTNLANVRSVTMSTTLMVNQ